MNKSGPQVPLTPAVFHILLALSGKERHGYDIMQQVKADSQGAVKMGPGTLYGSLDRMIEAGLVTKGNTRDQRRIYYKLTMLGKATLRAESERLSRLAVVARRQLGTAWCHGAHQAGDSASFFSSVRAPLGTAPEFSAQHRAEVLRTFEDPEKKLSAKAAFWLLIRKDLMFSVISRKIPKSLRGQTALMLIALAIVFAVLRAFTAEHYFMGAVAVCYGFVIGWFAGWMAKRRKASPSRIRCVLCESLLWVICWCSCRSKDCPLTI
jgi:DNA-binding PadR family transcriptional regulator